MSRLYPCTQMLMNISPLYIDFLLQAAIGSIALDEANYQISKGNLEGDAADEAIRQGTQVGDHRLNYNSTFTLTLRSVCTKELDLV